MNTESFTHIPVANNSVIVIPTAYLGELNEDVLATIEKFIDESGLNILVICGDGIECLTEKQMNAHGWYRSQSASVNDSLSQD